MAVAMKELIVIGVMGLGLNKMNLKPEDLEISTYPPYKTGGQHVGLTHSGVLVVHVPTGLGVVSISERSQYRNRERALVMLEILVELG